MPASSDKSNSTYSNSTEVLLNEKGMKQEANDQVILATEAESIADGSGKDNADQNAPLVSPSKGEDLEGDDDVDTELEKEHADNLRRKRDREGSLEPSFSSQQDTIATDTIPSKKNRLQHGAIAKEQTTPILAPSSPSLKSEGEKVGQIRKRVQDLSWKQRKEGDRDGGEDELEEEVEKEEDDDDDDDDNDDAEVPEKEEKEIATESTEKSAESKKTQPSFSSFASKPSAFAAAKNDENNFLSSPTSSSSSSTEKKTGSPPNSSRTQPTFSSFSKSSSPFNSMSSVAGPSWLAGKSGSGASVTTSASPGGGGIRPSSLGSVGAPSSSSSSDTVSAPVHSEKDQPASNTKTNTSSIGGKQLGFGAFAGKKTFTSRSSTPTTSSEKAINGDEGEENSPSRSFDDVLKQGEVKEAEVGIEANKVSTQLERGQADLRTGEEDEKTLASARSKLYTMSEDKNWKERGTGTVRCNVAKQNGGAGRLVMRSEGVLRLILNINLFKGMKIHLEQDKFLRIVAFEEEKLVHFAIKFANHAAASNFYRVVKETIPGENQGWESEA